MILAALLALQCPDGSPPPCSPPRVSPHSVAVLYFENQSRDSNDAYLASGLTEEITSRLGQHGRLQVTSRTTMQRFRRTETDPAQIARSLRVAYLVNGSVRRSGERLRVGVELVRARDGVQAWSQTFDRTSADLLAIEEEVAREVATAIAGRLLPDEQRAMASRSTANPAAYDRFLRGLHYLAQRTTVSLQRAIEEFEAATRLDPRFARAHSRIAHTYGLAAWRGDWLLRRIQPDSSWRIALAASQRAIQLDPSSSDAWMSRGVALIPSAESLATAHQALTRALALDSNNAEARHLYAWTLLYGGRRAEAMAEWHRTLRTDPLRPITMAVLAQTEFSAGNWAAAIRWADSALVIEPGFLQAHFPRYMASVEVGDYGRARSSLTNAAQIVGAAEMADALDAQIALRQGDSTRLRAFLAAPPPAIARDSSAWVSITMAALATDAGMLELALDWLERLTWRNSNVASGLDFRIFDRLRGHPRFARLRSSIVFAPLPR